MSSYRLQFGPHFTFADAQRLIPYLDALGITDCYASPLLQSAYGSSHGYDIIDHDRLNQELGTDQEFDALAATLRARDMGLILDFVPNHMGLDPSTNRWWRDVLQHGPASPYSDYFDIDWDPVTPELKGRVLLPILQDGYGDVLHRGELRLGFDDGDFHVDYGDRRLPVEPRSSRAILELARTYLPWRDSDENPDWQDYLAIQFLLDSVPPTSTANAALRSKRRLIARNVRHRLSDLSERSPSVRAAIERAVTEFNGTPDNPDTFDRLHGLLEEQPYRMAHWKVAFDEINYRRFFDINELGALRMENPRVFQAAHQKMLELVGERKITGLRIDHPDGLLDPASYFADLQRATADALMTNGHASPENVFYIVAEKILSRDEVLPDDWPINGTTGYGFLNAVNGLFIDSANRTLFSGVYAKATGRRDSFPQIAYHAKRLVMGSSMASELAVLARALKAIAASDRRTRDFTLTALSRTIVEVVACLPRYRTYVSRSGFSATDRETIDVAVDRARRLNPVMAQSMFLFLRNVLLAEGNEHDDAVRWRRQFAMKFQQFSAPVQAKGVEDTSFYRANTLLSLNEVGGDPSRFGTSVDEFHASNRVRQERWPREMLTTATHDTKRGEDVRARLNLLSEMPAAWRKNVAEWREINVMHRTAVDRLPAPDANDEYLFYQTLLGSWPAEAIDAPIPIEAPQDLVDRLRTYMLKAIREAKTHTSWVNQNTAYEDAVSRFVESALKGSGANRFLTTFIPFKRRVSVGGMVNSLSQLVLKIASPGMPDFYQGTEVWQLDMADPDNRRPVDFADRQATLQELMPWITRAESGTSSANTECLCDPELEEHVRGLMASWPDGRIKTFVMAIGLRLRRRHPSLFIEGQYDPLRPEGPGADHIVVFSRMHEGQTVIAAVPRLINKRLDGLSLPIGNDAWADTRIEVPADVSSVRNLLTGARLKATEGHIFAANVFRMCPVALLIAER